MKLKSAYSTHAWCCMDDEHVGVASLWQGVLLQSLLHETGMCEQAFVSYTVAWFGDSWL